MKNIVGAVIGLLFALGAIGGYAYLIYEVHTAMNTGATARAEGVAAEEQDRFASTAQTLLAGLAVEQVELETYVAKDADFVAVIEAIEGAAAREGVKASIGSVNVIAGSSQFHETVTVTASSRGTFKNITSFISALGTLPLASRVSAVALEASGDNSWFATVTLEVLKRKP